MRGGVIPEVWLFSLLLNFENWFWQCSVGLGWDVAGIHVQLSLILFSQVTAACCTRQGGFLNLGFTPEHMVRCLWLRLTVLDAQITLSERFPLGRNVSGPPRGRGKCKVITWVVQPIPVKSVAGLSSQALMPSCRCEGHTFTQLFASACACLLVTEVYSHQ